MMGLARGGCGGGRGGRSCGASQFPGWPNGSLASHGCVAAGSLAAISALHRLVSPTVSRLLTEIKCRKGKEPAHGPDAVVECILMSRQVPVAVNDTLPAQVADMVADCISAGAGVGE